MSYQNEEEGVVHVWNTGRQYDKRGQIIAAIKIKHKDRIVFWDDSRHIDGTFPAKRGNLQEQVIAAYDNGCYKCPTNGDNAVLKMLKENAERMHPKEERQCA